MRTARRITGVTVKTILEGRTVDVVFRSPYRWRIYEDEQEVTKDFGFNGRPVTDDAAMRDFHDKVDAGEISHRIQAQF